jgi:membrane protein DedA with SNARE-associated domain
VVNVAALIGTYGYPLVLLGAIAEGEVVVITAGYLAHRHHLDVWVVASCAAVGGAVGDLGYFLLGRHFGERALHRLPASIGTQTDRARAAVDRNPVRVLLGMRFVYGMRIVLPLLCGVSSIKLSRFVRYDVGTSIVWAGLFTGIGYGVGAVATAAIRQIERYEWIVFCGVAALALLLGQVSKPLRRWLEPKATDVSRT